MKKRFVLIVLTVFFLSLFALSGLADKADGDLYAFCPYLSTSRYNSFLQSFLDLNSSQIALFKVTSDGFSGGTLVYSDLLQTTFFIFGGVSSEFDTADTAFIKCSLKDSSTLKNIPMIIWASVIQFEYTGAIEETGESFLEWVNDDRKDGDIFFSPYFIASYNETPGDYCSLLLVRH